MNNKYIKFNFFLKISFGLCSMYLNRKLFWKVHLELIDFHKKYAENKILLEYNKILKFCNKLFASAMIFCIVLLNSYPIVDSIFFAKKKVLGLGYIIPFTYPDENIGFILNFIFQNIQCALSGYGYVVFLRINWLYFAHTCVRIDILKNTVNDLKENITDTYDENNNQIISLKLNEIVQLHVEYLRFNNLFCSFFF